MASGVYDSFKKGLLDGTYVMATASAVKVMLVTSAYIPNFKTHVHRSDVTYEVVGAGYVAGGVVLGGTSTANDTTNDRGQFLAANAVWNTATITARGAVLYQVGGTAATDNLIGYIDFIIDKATAAGTFTIQWNAAGVLTVT